MNVIQRFTREEADAYFVALCEYLGLNTDYVSPDGFDATYAGGGDTAPIMVTWTSQHAMTIEELNTLLDQVRNSTPPTDPPPDEPEPEPAAEPEPDA